MMFLRVLICLITVGLGACSVTEDHPAATPSSSYHEISLPRANEDVPSRPSTEQAEELHVNNCQMFFDATLASAAQKLTQHHRM